MKSHSGWHQRRVFPDLPLPKRRLARLVLAGTFFAVARLAVGDPAPARITVQADRTLFRLSDLMIGANMEDLHYQMTGGLSSQLIHGESFFEPTPTDVARKCQPFLGFTARGGRWRFERGELTAVVGNSVDDLSAVPAAAGVIAKGVGARLSSDAPAVADSVRISAEICFPVGAIGSAGLVFGVQANQADEKWEWFSGYAAELLPAEGRVTLKRADRANRFVEVGSAAVSFPPGAWIKLGVKIADARIAVEVNGRETLVYKNLAPLAAGRFGVVARDNVRFRRLMLSTGSNSPSEIELKVHPLIQNAGDAISLRWQKVRTGTAEGHFAHDTAGGWLPGKPSQGIVFESGEGELGIDNAGLARWGLHFRKDKPYDGFVRIKGVAGTEITVSLRSADGQSIFASQSFRLAGSAEKYQRLAFTLTPGADASDARFAITLKKPGAITVGYAFLEPGEWGRFCGLPIRRDLADAVVAQGIRVLRMNGGMIERPDYRWANMQGPRDRRPPYDGFYDRWCSQGFGLIEFLQFCEAAGLVPIPALNLDETPGAVADFLAYATAPAETSAGKRRAADGHPAPFKLPFFQVANESQFNDAYVEKFKQVAEAAWKVAPEITLITTSTGVKLKEADDEAVTRAKLDRHLDLVRFCEARGKKIIFDSHSFSGAGGVRDVAFFGRSLKKLVAQPNDVAMGVFEFNAGAFDLARGLSHALEMNAAYRAGDVIRGVGTPNLSQPWGVYQTDWKAVLWTQGNIYYSQDKVWYQPTYFVDQMIASSWAPDAVAVGITGPAEGLDVFAGRSADGHRLVIRVVNSAAKPVAVQIDVSGFTPGNKAPKIE